jgi:hypothetical protein
VKPINATSIGKRNSPPPRPITPPIPPISSAQPRAIVVVRQPEKTGATAGTTELVVHPHHALWRECYSA